MKRLHDYKAALQSHQRALAIRIKLLRDASFRGYVTSKSVNNLHEYTFQFFCYVYLNLSTQKNINFLTRESQQIVVV